MRGGSVGWNAQARDDHAVPLGDALSQLWPQTLLGLTTVIVLALTVPAAVPYALFIAAGPLLSIPLAVITARPRIGHALMRLGIGRLPEETILLPELRALAMPIIEVGAVDRAA